MDIIIVLISMADYRKIRKYREKLMNTDSCRLKFFTIKNIRTAKLGKKFKDSSLILIKLTSI